MNRSFAMPRDPISAYTHLAGVFLSVAGTICMCIQGYNLIGEATAKFAAAVIFGLSLTALYAASTIYHWCNGSSKTQQILRKLDHSMIYVLIAGTYTPILIGNMEQHKALIFTGIMWGLAAFGIIMKLCWMNAPRILSTMLYLIMGWAIAFDFSAISNMKPGAFMLLLAGGIFYTIGGIIYAVKKPNISKSFGFHEIFHVFVLLGSLFHYLVVVLYVL